MQQQAFNFWFCEISPGSIRDDLSSGKQAWAEQAQAEQVWAEQAWV
jgi:hypothetical protein